ncbi:hypothetical protein Ccrd_005910 [Cynara cardunculus var. scolymus]|uniref:PHD-type domain-containing protein n=1 Tax=Cynara cardunculus var. scolymus TaxID=59895 RepID=A0A118JUH6_CYNCS|nr:hypothetical protein Ccrd_005910 [Cynara cardunculus var. scolymus]
MKLLDVLSKFAEQSDRRIIVERLHPLEFNQRLHEYRSLIARCRNCGSGDNKDQLLICDKCGQGYHMSCLFPILDRVPVGPWYCRICYILSRRPKSTQRNSFNSFSPYVDLYNRRRDHFIFFSNLGSY